MENPRDSHGQESLPEEQNSSNTARSRTSEHLKKLRNLVGKTTLAIGGVLGGADTAAQEPPMLLMMKPVTSTETEAPVPSIETVKQPKIAYPYETQVRQSGRHEYKLEKVLKVQLDTGEVLPFYYEQSIGDGKTGVFATGTAGRGLYVDALGVSIEIALSTEVVKPPVGFFYKYEVKNGEMIRRLPTDEELKEEQSKRSPASSSASNPYGGDITEVEEKEMPQISEAKTPPSTFIEVSPAVKEAQEEIKKLGLFTIEHGFDFKNTKEAALHNRSVIAPSGYTLMPITITTAVDSDGRGKVLLPVPRDLSDFHHVAGEVLVLKNGKEMQEEVRLIYSVPNKQGIGYINPFVRIDIKDLPGKLEIRTQHWIMVPTYTAFSYAEMTARMGPDAANAASAALNAGCNIPWSLETDCGVKADAATRAGAGFVDKMVGYSFSAPTSIPKFGGRHAINIVSTPGGVVTFDATDHQTKYVGPLHKFIPAYVGDSNSVPSWGMPFDAANGGRYAGVRDFSSAALSIPGQGEYGAILSQLQPPEAVRTLAEALWQDRMEKVYGQKGPAVAVAAVNQVSQSEPAADGVRRLDEAMARNNITDIK